MKTATEKVTKEILIEAFTKARLACAAANPGDEKDSGSCNMDTPIVKLPLVTWKMIEDILAGMEELTASQQRLFRKVMEAQ